jgi:predicted DNA-binding transcriptional regulator
MSLSPSHIRTFRLLKHTAIVYLLLLYLDQPTGESEVARILEIDRKTARKHLLSLTYLGLVTRLKRQSGYILTGAGRQMILGESPTEEPNIKKMGRFSPFSIVNTVNVVNDEELKEKEINHHVGKFSPVEDDPKKDPIWDALNAAGISRNRRTARLAKLPHITPEYITAHHQALKESGKGNSTGLLITILESGKSPPSQSPLADLDPDIEYLRLNPHGKFRKSAFERLKARHVSLPPDLAMDAPN